MPGFCTHYYFGVHTMDALMKDSSRASYSLKSALTSERGVYQLGLQGPDLFFYFLPSYIIHPENLGHIMHTRRTGEFLKNIAQNVMAMEKSTDRKIGFAYLAGFLGHYLLDSKAHPYIYFMTGYDAPSAQYSAKHMEFETEVDQLVFEHYLGKYSADFSQSNSIRLSPKQLAVVSSLLGKTLKETYPELVGNALISGCGAFSFRAGVSFLCGTKHDAKKKFFASLEKKIVGHKPLSCLIPSHGEVKDFDPLNLRHQLWRNPWDENLTSHDDFLTIFEECCNRYEKLLILTDSLVTAFETKSATRGELLRNWISVVENRSYLTGLELIPGKSFHSVGVQAPTE